MTDTFLTPGLLLVIGIAAPWLAALLLLPISRSAHRWLAPIATVGFAVPALIALVLWIQFDPSRAGEFQFLIDYPTGLEYFLGVSLKLGLNGISLPLYLLAAWVGLAAGLYSLKGTVKASPQYLVLLLVMQGGMMGMFAAIDLFFFYFFHEVALIPTFIMMAGWGSSGRRAAAMTMAIYLTIGAMLSLGGLIALYHFSGAESFDIISLKAVLVSQPLSDSLQSLLFGILVFGFGILVSLWPLHNWAVPTYAKAPTGAAMLHAGVLKNFGLYGLIQFAIPCLPLGALAWGDLILYLALGNVLIIGWVTMAQPELKQMVAYSSVMHIGYVFLGAASLSILAVNGAVLLMVGHGLSIALLLMLSTALHHRSGTFMMDEMGGLARKMPILAVLFVMGSLASIGLPGFANFWGELTIFIGLWGYEPWIAILAMLGIVISAIYALRALAKVFFLSANC